MKNKKRASASLTFTGIISFFLLIAFIMQIAILVYDYIRKQTDNVTYIALLILVEIIILSAFCTVFDYFRRKLTVERPTQKILEATEKIAQGDFTVRLDITREYGKYNQYDYIMQNLNVMAAELQKKEALSVDFISNVSHEIKTPLSVIQNYAKLLENDGLPLETRKEYTKTLINASKRITDLVSNVLKLNKLENQEIQEKKESFSLTDSLAETVVEFESLIENKNINLNCNFEEVTVTSSKSLLDIVFSNLISNAVKFTGEGGEITVTLKRDGNNAVVTVSDTGIGMSNEVGQRIFEKFYQADTSRSTQGNGLGLALVKKVIDILGGEISVKSELNKGSTFKVVLKGVINEELSN